MFENRAFNEDISNWDVSKVEDMTQMFYAKYYNFSFKYLSDSEISKMNIYMLDEKEKIDKKWEVYRDLSKTKMSDYEILKKIGMYFPVHFKKIYQNGNGLKVKYQNIIIFSVDETPRWVKQLNVDKDEKNTKTEKKQVTLFTKDRYPQQFLDNKLGYKPSRSI